MKGEDEIVIVLYDEEGGEIQRTHLPVNFANEPSLHKIIDPNLSKSKPVAWYFIMIKKNDG